MLFVSKVPMVNGTIFSAAMVSFSIMVSSSGSSPSRTGEPEPLPLPPPSTWRCHLASRMRRSASSLFGCEFGDGFEAIELTYLASCSMLS
jgi:hypothetical protein